LFDDQTITGRRDMSRSTARGRVLGQALGADGAAGRLASLLGYNLRLAQVRVFQDFAVTMAAFALTPGQLGALLLIEARPGLSQSALGAALGIDRSSVVPLIDGLQARGLVRRAARADDRRAHALELSEAGAALLRRLTPALERHERRIARRLTAPERARLIDYLSRVAAP
jgi:DNA-binding MarR family transcriptional regulator